MLTLTSLLARAEIRGIWHKHSHGGSALEKELTQARLLGDLIHSLNVSENASDFCKALVHFVLREEQAVAAHLLRLTDDSRVELVGSYGYSPAETDTFNVSVWDPSPSASAIRGGSTMTTKSSKALQYDQAGLLVIPIMRNLGPIGCLGIEFRDNVSNSLLTDEAQWAFRLAGRASINRWQDREVSKTTSAKAKVLNLQTALSELTKRQLVILEHIVDQKTNAEIARLINLSESAIKKETVRIFKIFAVNSRQEARRVAIELGIGHQDLPDAEEQQLTA